MRRKTVDYDVPGPVPGDRLPLGKRLARFFGLLGALFAVAMAVIVTQRLSRDSLALLIGLSCGVMAMVPTLALGFLVWRRETARHPPEPESRPAHPPSPPVIVVTPQGLPNYGDRSKALPAAPWQWATPQNQREFTIVGGEE
jgi:hypothetical protein